MTEQALKQLIKDADRAVATAQAAMAYLTGRPESRDGGIESERMRQGRTETGNLEVLAYKSAAYVHSQVGRGGFALQHVGNKEQNVCFSILELPLWLQLCRTNPTRRSCAAQAHDFRRVRLSNSLHRDELWQQVDRTNLNSTKAAERLTQFASQS